ncbi:MAG: gamma-glutamylcyclotransferase [Bacteroidetes bacterium]|nr:gamma-glutamylcyclotransferase [Bacteroidota bacterium]
MEVLYLKYFAYGSNMSLKALDAMGIKYKEVQPAVLKNWELIFNVPEIKSPGFGYANVIQKDGSVVKGLLMDLHPDSLQILDEYEVFPLDYLKKEVSVDLKSGASENCFIYVGNPLVVSSVLLQAFPEHLAIIERAHF